MTAHDQLLNIRSEGQGALGAVWQEGFVSSPHLLEAIPVVVARGISYIRNANRLQNFTIYLPSTLETRRLVGSGVLALPGRASMSAAVRYQVHIHGGAWRDPFLSAESIEASVAHTFSTDGPLEAIIGINYSLTRFPTHPIAPYDPIPDNHIDIAREAVHPQQVSDALHAFALLRELGLADDSYVLTGHSCGSCIAFQSVLQPPSEWGLGHLPPPPRPAVQVGINGLYDLPALVHELGSRHENLRGDYAMFLANTLGPDENLWTTYSPAHLATTTIAAHLRDGHAPARVILHQSMEDQLVPANQRERLTAALEASGISVTQGDRATGAHAAAWEEGYMFADAVADAIALIDQERTA